MQPALRCHLRAISVTVFALLAFTGPQGAKADDRQGESPVGSWIGTVTPSGSAGFTDLMIINEGGTITGTNGDAYKSQIPLPPFVRVNDSDFFGAWEPTGHPNEFAGVVKWLIFLGPNNPPDKGVTDIYCPGNTCQPGPYPGQNIGVVTLQTVLTVKHNTAKGPYTLQYTDLNGNVVFPSSGTLDFTRFGVEP